jgi:hypothetical protein
MNQPSLSNIKTWRNFEKYALEVLDLSLKMLREKPSLPEAEDLPNGDNLNRQLCSCIHEVVYQWELEREEDLPFTLNLKRDQAKQPDFEKMEEFQDFERKKPDFQWTFTDRLDMSSSNSYFKNYDIECKRLGGSSFPKEYVINGVMRFIKKSHCYGQFTSSGVMIGYVQNLDFEAILDKVNNVASSNSLPKLLPASESWNKDVSRLDHKLDRLDIEPTPFDLRHLWVDLRHHYVQQDILIPEKKSPKYKKKAKPKNVTQSAL